MEVREIKIPKARFKPYIKQLIDLENIFGKYNQKNDNKIVMKNTGYLIDKNDFDNFKSKLYYSLFKTLINDDSKFKEKLDELYGNNKEITFIPFEQKNFSSSRDLIDNLYKNNEYVIITLLVWKIINNGKYKENVGKISFEIKNDKILLNFGTGANVYFKYNLNIISYKNLTLKLEEKEKIAYNVQNHKKSNGEGGPIKLIINENKNYKITLEKLIEKLYKSMIEYNNFEKLLMNKLKLNGFNNNEIIEGYFLEKNWFSKWIELTNYDNNRFLLLNNKNDKHIDEIKGNIKITSENDIYPISLIKYFNNNNFESKIKTDIIILVNEEFLSLFEKDLEYQQKYKTKFKIEKQKFIFLFDKNEKKSIYSINNILPKEKTKCFKIANNLIELYIFQEKLKKRIKIGKKDETENLILLDTKYMKYIKNKYSFNKICDSIKGKSLIISIINELIKTDKNRKYILNDIISDFNWECFFDIYNANINEINDNYGLEINEINLDNNNKINYFDNFELIDINIFNNLNIKETISNKISKKIKEYYIYNNKILIKYENEETKDIYMIGQIQDNNIFVSEYYIDPLDSIGLKTFLTKYPISDILKGNHGYIINSNNKKIGKLYKINKEIVKEQNISKIFEAILDLYKFDKELQNQINDNSNNIFEGKLYLIIC